MQRTLLPPRPLSTALGRPAGAGGRGQVKAPGLEVKQQT